MCVRATVLPSSPPLLFPFSKQSAHSSLGLVPSLVDTPGRKKKRNVFRSVLVNDLPQKGLLSHLPSLLITYFLKTRRRRGTDTQREETGQECTHIWDGEKKHQHLTWHMILRFVRPVRCTAKFLGGKKKINGGETADSSGGHSCSEQRQAHAPPNLLHTRHFAARRKNCTFQSPVIVHSSGCICAIITLFNQTLVMQHLAGGWNILAKGLALPNTDF